MKAAIIATALLFSISPFLLGCAPTDRDSVAAEPTVAATATDPAARGRYLVDGLLRCTYRHSQRDWDQPGAPVAAPVGAGVVLQEEGEYRIVASNITPDDQTGIGLRTDDQLERAIRQEIGHDGRPLATDRGHREYRHLSDADVAAVIAYLRTIEPVNNPLPATVPPPDLQEDLDASEPTDLEPLPLDQADPVEQGRVLARFARCQGCHTSWYSERNPGVFAGGNLIEGENGNVFTTNITPDPSGVRWDAETFIEVMRTGKTEGLHPYMPWIMFRNLSDEDLRAIHAFLQSMQPVAHYINNYAAPTYCPVCGQVH